jgi:mannose-6-phosphate isomerase
VRAAAWEETLAPGNSCLLPACLGETVLVPERRASLLKAYVPDLIRDVIEPLRRAGVEDERIALLGARTRLNPLKGLL